MSKDNKRTLKKMIFAYVKKRAEKAISHEFAYVDSKEIEKIAVNKWGYKRDTASRECRELAKEHIFERQIMKSKKGKDSSVWYRLDARKFKRVGRYEPDLEKTVIRYEPIRKDSLRGYKIIS